MPLKDFPPAAKGSDLYKNFTSSICHSRIIGNPYRSLNPTNEFVGFRTGCRVGANPQVACRKIFSLTEIIQTSSFVYEIFPGILNDNQNQSLQNGNRDMNCFATHLLEQGEDLRHIQKILGHKSTKTPINFFKTTGQATEIYTHITKKGFSKILSPLDNINFED